jgi:integrase
VIVNAGKGKFASAHDLRRSFGTRWAGRVKPAILQLLMRHESIETTMKYYVDQDADDISDQLWLQHESTPSPLPPLDAPSDRLQSCQLDGTKK